MKARRGVTLCVATLAASLLACASACSSSNHGNPATIADTTGSSFDWTCSDNGCDMTPRAGTPAFTCGGGYVVGRLFVIDPFPSPAFGRAVVCGQDGDCPQFAERGYGCHGGLCESRDAEPLTQIDVLALCLATTPRLGRCSDVVQDSMTEAEIQASNAVCGQGGTCSGVPGGCRGL